jgi:hypothetical protein
MCHDVVLLCVRVLILRREEVTKMKQLRPPPGN